LQPDDVRVELVAAWKKANPSVVLRAFLELIDTNAAQIRSKGGASLAKASDALRYLVEGHPFGKVALTI
jgi:hypothetical protein